MVANRLSLVLPYIIEDYQTGFMKDRYIAQNLLELISIIDYCEKESLDSIIISYDFFKAFDTVCWTSMQSILDFFGFGPYFRLLVRILQNDIYAVVTNNNHWSDRFKIERGLPQGSPASSFLFIVQTQVLASRISQNDSIKGISINGIEKKLNQYADDLWTPMLFDQTSYDEMMNELDQFEKLIGLRINYKKTKVLRTGSLIGSQQKLVSERPIQWTNNSVTILGIPIFANTRKTKELAYEEAFAKMQGTLKV